MAILSRLLKVAPQRGRQSSDASARVNPKRIIKRSSSSQLRLSEAETQTASSVPSARECVCVSVCARARVPSLTPLRYVPVCVFFASFPPLRITKSVGILPVVARIFPCPRPAAALSLATKKRASEKGAAIRECERANGRARESDEHVYKYSRRVHP